MLLVVVWGCEQSYCYLGRLDAELEKLLGIQEEKSSVADHYRQQYASREDAIRTAMVRERQLFESSGIGASMFLEHIEAACHVWIFAKNGNKVQWSVDVSSTSFIYSSTIALISAVAFDHRSLPGRLPIDPVNLYFLMN
eukprot:Em0002g998a